MNARSRTRTPRRRAKPAHTRPPRQRSSRGASSGSRPPVDRLLLWAILALVVIGIITLSSASVVLSQENFGNNSHYFLRQLLNGGLLGMIALFVMSRIPYRSWKTYAFLGLIATVVLLLLVFIPGISLEHGGARRWVVIGGFSLQPAEIVKLTFLLYLATWLEKREGDLENVQSSFLPFMAVLGVVGFLIMLQPDLGTMLVIMAMSILVYFVAGAPWKHLAWIGVAGVALVILLIQIAPYRLSRLDVFLHPEKDPQGIGYQINQARLAIGSGGAFGRGIGQSIQKHNYLPEPIGDSIFAVMAEELGFVRVSLIVLLYFVVAWRGFLIARTAPDLFGRLVATGLTGWVIFQAFMNIGAISGLLPLTGITLPFISYGGSALLFTLAGMGILLNISRYAALPSRASLASSGGAGSGQVRDKRLPPKESESDSGDAA